MTDVLTFDDAMKSVSGLTKRHLLLGNGFSISLKPDIFSYGALFDSADFSSKPHIKTLFQKLGTQDFEIVIKHLLDAASVLDAYGRTDPKLAKDLRSDAAAIKDALVTAIAKRHPDRPHDVKPEQYAACRKFLSRFDHMFTLNYDVLLYWTLMQSDVDRLIIRHDDGFRHPEDDPSAPWVSWQQGNAATVSYLHGALHLFDAGSEITKYTWSKTDKPIVEQIRASLDDEKYPLFVAEGTSANKLERILHNAYLHKALRSFEGCQSATAAVVIFGHSLADNDRHVLKCIAKGNAPYLLVSLYGDPSSDSNKKIINAAAALVTERGPAGGRKKALEVRFYDAASVKLWG
jgi:hypothetical protein